MNTEAAAVALNLITLIAAGAYAFAQRPDRGASPVDQRLGALITVFMLLVGVRAARWWIEAEALRRVEEALAGFIPLFALFLAEGLQRKHAPRWMKYAISAGALVFAIVAALRPMQAAQTFAYALGGFVSLTLFALAGLLAVRDRASLARAENDAINALFVGLIIALPLAASDFLWAAGALPFHAGGIGLLVFLLAVARVTAIGGGGLGFLQELGGSFVAATVSFGFFVFVLGMPEWLQAFNIASLIWALVLTFRIVQYPVEQAAARARSSLWRAFAEAPMSSFDAFLDRMLGAPELNRARLIESADLAGYDERKLSHAFAASPVLTASSARADEQLNVLVDENEATHVVMLSAAPLRLLFVTMPRVGAGGDVALQLQVLAKLAERTSHA